MPEPTAVNPQTGERVVFRNGQWEPMGGAAPVASAPPAPVNSGVNPAAERAVEASARGDAAAQLARERFEYQQGRDRVADERRANPATSAPTAQQTARLANLESLTEQINRVQELYDSTLRDEANGIFSSAAEYLPTPDNRRFDSAAAGMAEQGLAAFRVPGVGAQSDAELRQFVEANRPGASDYDTQIEEKLSQLRRRVDATRQGLGLEPAQWQSGTAEQTDETPPAFGGEGAPPAGPTDGAPPVIGPNGDGRILGNTHNGGDDREGTGIETGEARREDDPILAGVREGYTQRLMEGQSPEQLLRYLRSAGATINQPLVQSVREQAAFRAENPGVPAGEYDTTQLDDRFIEVGAASRGAGELARNPVGTYVANAADALTGFNLDSLVGMTGGNAEQTRAGMDQISRENPYSALAGTISGGTMAALTAELGLARAGVASGLPRALMADSGYGAVAGAGATDYAEDGSPATMADRARGGAMGAVAGLAGSYGGQKVGNALASVARGSKDAAVNALRGEGVNALTIGQSVGGGGMVGRAVKGVEDRLAGVPVVGDMINARRSEGVRQFNTAAFNRALEPIGGKVGELVGEEAIAAAQDQVSQAYVTALAGKGALPDQAFERSLSEAVMGVGSIKRLGDELHQGIGEIFQPYADDAMLSGEALDDISRNLRDLKQAYRQDPLYPRVVRQVDRIERAVFDLFDRQASGTIPEYMAARQAYRRISTLEDAVMKARNQDDRVFTPAQLGQADQANTRRFGGKRAAASGNTPFYELQTAGQAVLPNKVPDSGTAGRMLVPLALVGGAGGADAATGGGGATGLTIGAILASLYTRTGQRILTKGTRGMEEGTRRRAVLESTRTKRAIQMGTAGGSAALVTDQR